MSNIRVSGNNDGRDHKVCMKCGTKRAARYFYRSYIAIHNDQMLPICKNCLRETGDKDIYDTRELQELLRNVDRPFIKDVWDVSIGEGQDGRIKKSVTGVYFKNINLSHSRYLTWEDSVFESSEVTVGKGENSKSVDRNRIDELEVRWGAGYTPAELVVFDKKYENLVGNYPVSTSLHEEALKTYVRYQARAEDATARGDARDAKTWGDLAQKQGEIAKINLNKLTKSDLSQGLDGFGQLARMVEEEIDIIPILPKFIASPNDKIDQAIWCYVNYERDLNGMPQVEHSDIYDFYQDMIKDRVEIDPELEEFLLEEEISHKGGKKKILTLNMDRLIEEKQRERPNDPFIQNLHKWVEFISWSLFFP